MINIEKIKEEIKKSTLGWEDKLDSLILLDKATKAIPSRDLTETIDILKRLYSELKNEEYKEVILGVIDKYRAEKKSLDYSFELPVTLRSFLKSLDISTKNISDEVLDKKIQVAIDDGMGYSPSGFHDIISSYTEEGQDITIWI